MKMTQRMKIKSTGLESTSRYVESKVLEDLCLFEVVEQRFWIGVRKDIGNRCWTWAAAAEEEYGKMAVSYCGYTAFG